MNIFKYYIILCNKHTGLSVKMSQVYTQRSSRFETVKNLNFFRQSHIGHLEVSSGTIREMGYQHSICTSCNIVGVYESYVGCMSHMWGVWFIVGEYESYVGCMSHMWGVFKYRQFTLVGRLKESIIFTFTFYLLYW